MWTETFFFGTQDDRLRATLEKMRELALEGGANPIIRAHAIRILRGVGPNTSDQAERLARYVQTLEFRRDPIAGELLQSPRVTLETVRGGDCDDLSTLLASLLLSVGIPALFALSKDDAANPAQFSHVLLAAQTERGILFLDPSRRDGRTGPVSLTDAVLVPVEGGKQMIGNLAALPADELARKVIATPYINYLRSVLNLPSTLASSQAKAAAQAEIDNVLAWTIGESDAPPNIERVREYLEAGRARDLDFTSILPTNQGAIPLLPPVNVGAFGLPKWALWLGAGVVVLAVAGPYLKKMGK